MLPGGICNVASPEKKPQNLAKDLETAHKNVGLPCKMLIKPIKNSFSYLIYSFRSLLKNKGAINYLFGSMDNIPDRIMQ